MIKRIRIVHTTEYQYREPVTFGVHRVLMRPREGHDIRITEASVEVVPRASVDWLRDIHGNSIAMITFLEPSPLLRIHSDLIVDLNEARFVTGYIQMGGGQHGATHAWTEIYLPGAGWRGFDPTNNKMAGSEHVAVAVTREQEKASPISGSWDGPPDAFESMNVVVRVEAT
jgi:transglutaminase-like putative cysteine protease